jgi:hypothetical protein
MKAIRLYFRELNYLRAYIITTIVVLGLSYSVYFFLDEATIASLGDEDHFFEWMTSLCFLFCSGIFLYIAIKKKNLILLLFAIAFFVGFGEEISWGQRIFNFKTPEKLLEINQQEEFNFHNIMTWEINFIFKVFTLAYGIILPFCIFHISHLEGASTKLKLVIPPISLGMFFLIDWLVFKFFLEYVLAYGMTPKYYFALTEIYEFGTSFILLLISLFFLQSIDLYPEGTDIKKQLYSIPSGEVAKIPVPETVRHIFGFIRI